MSNKSANGFRRRLEIAGIPEFDESIISPCSHHIGIISGSDWVNVKPILCKYLMVPYIISSMSFVVLADYFLFF